MITGIFSGSFNPVHIGHLALANWICEFCDMDEVWFLVSPQNPLKKESELVDETVRFQMVEAAICGYPKFKTSDFEFLLPRPSYTINTFRALQETFPDRIFQLIIGADSWNGIEGWKDYETLLAKFRLLVYPRKGYEITIPKKYPNIIKVEAPLIEISSTFIRQSIQAGKDIRFFLPEALRNKQHLLIPSEWVTPNFSDDRHTRFQS
jgi:nicotinate-nucleotide adenylyltransferase